MWKPLELQELFAGDVEAEVDGEVAVEVAEAEVVVDIEDPRNNKWNNNPTETERPINTHAKASSSKVGLAWRSCRWKEFTRLALCSQRIPQR